MLPFFLLFLRLVALEVTFIAIAYRLNGLFATIQRCFPLQSVRIAAENRLVCGQKSSPFGAPCLRKQLLKPVKSAFLCNVYKLLCKTLCLLSITKRADVVYTKDTNAWWGRYARKGLQPCEFMQMLKRRNAL